MAGGVWTRSKHTDWRCGHVCRCRPAAGAEAAQAGAADTVAGGHHTWRLAMMDRSQMTQSAACAALSPAGRR